MRIMRIQSSQNAFASRSVRRHKSIPGHSIAVVRALKSSLWDTAGGKEPNIRPKNDYSQAGANLTGVALAGADEDAGGVGVAVLVLLAKLAAAVSDLPL